ncbi:zinc finger and SCAN domain-containing protein 31-like [Anopheles darlingi]|uniref:zinc finger and SCAN domain-containing protein 31-like n=1 Tax=Anopheles darlingi TaxID=43151 RepID=UPI0020FFFD9D|nr:zinc finger and SCAN domain-containing protein 31-like [Anopheles darlingi]
MLAKYCRVCLSSLGVVHRLNEQVHKTMTLYAMLCKMYPEAFIEYDDPQWPTRVCGNCKRSILNAFRLYTVCMASFEVFKNELQQSSIKTERDEIDGKEAVIIIDGEENDQHFLSSDHEEGLKTIKVKTSVKEHDLLEILVLNEDQASDSEAQPQGLEYDDLDASQEINSNQWENAMVERAIAVPEVSDAIVDSDCMIDDTEESEDESVFGEIFSSQIFSCKSCKDVFDDKKTLEKHLKYHRVGFHIFCKMCHKAFKHQTALYAHKCAFDSSTLCWICGKLLDTLETRKIHMETHMPEGLWACQLCPLRFSTQTAMENHEYMHKKDIRHCCDICGVNLSSKRNLKYHQVAVHGGGVEKLHQCNVCGRRFSLPCMLKTHMNTHTGLRPYSCVYCNRVYGNGSDLVEHVAKHHVGNDNIYQCHLCDADFAKIRDLKAHYEVHDKNGKKLHNEILTDFGKFRFTITDLLKMRHQKEMVAVSSIVLPDL